MVNVSTRPSARRSVLHWSITPRGGWHSHATAFYRALDQLEPGQHAFAHWANATPAPVGATVPIAPGALGARASAAVVHLSAIRRALLDGDHQWLHLHGLPSEPVGSLFTLALLAMARPVGVHLAVTPHNRFGRRGPIEFNSMRHRSLGKFDRVIVFDQSETEWGGPRSVVAPFLHPVDDVAGHHTDAASSEATRPPASGTVDECGLTVCLPGQIRTDKGFDVVPAALTAADRIRLAGPDKGGLSSLQAEAAAHHIPIVGSAEFVAEDEFQAAIAESDVVVLPYRRTTRSGIVAYAQALGTPVVGSAAVAQTGMAVDAVFEPDDPDHLRRAIGEALIAGARGSKLPALIADDLYPLSQP